MKAARRSRDARVVDERFARFGPFKELARHPTGQRALAQLERAWWPPEGVIWAKPVVGGTQGFIVLFMAYRGGMHALPLAMLVVVLSGLHPHALLLALLLLKLLFAKGNPRPRSCPPSGVPTLVSTLVAQRAWPTAAPPLRSAASTSWWTT
jgi:hypothetical protein